jgi:tetratricopeptide (TPR) repeat protein
MSAPRPTPTAYRGVYCKCRGVVYEALGRYDDAVVDYQAVLKAQPNDPSGWNNLGNCRMAQVQCLPLYLISTQEFEV